MSDYPRAMYRQHAEKDLIQKTVVSSEQQERDMASIGFTAVLLEVLETHPTGSPGVVPEYQHIQIEDLMSEVPKPEPKPEKKGKKDE